MINYDSDRGIDVSTRTGIYLVPTKHLPSLLTEINFLINHCKYVPNNILLVSIAEFAYSELLIRRAGQQHSGNYSCVPSNALPTAVTVHIFTGKWRPTHSPTEAVPTLLLLYSCVPYQSVSVSLLLKGKSSSAYDLPHEILELCSRHNWTNATIVLLFDFNSLFYTQLNMASQYSQRTVSNLPFPSCIPCFWAPLHCIRNQRQVSTANIILQNCTVNRLPQSRILCRTRSVWVIIIIKIAYFACSASQQYSEWIFPQNPSFASFFRQPMMRIGRGNSNALNILPESNQNIWHSLWRESICAANFHCKSIMCCVCVVAPIKSSYLLRTYIYMNDGRYCGCSSSHTTQTE